jgi:arginine-tRNA-protein transferase
MEFARQKKIQHFYLGYYITTNQSLNYKANFRPNEVYIDHEWRPYRNVSGDYLLPKDKLQWKNFDTLVKAASQPQYF